MNSRKMEIIHNLSKTRSKSSKNGRFFPTENMIVNKVRFAAKYLGIISEDDNRIRYLNGLIAKQDIKKIDIDFCKPICSLMGVDWKYLEDDKCLLCDIDKYLINNRTFF